MHASQLVEWSALLAANSRLLLASNTGLRAEGLEQYWIASKCRLDRWGMALTMYSTRVRSGRTDTAALWHELRPVLEEVFLSEMLTRVWTAICCAADRGLPHDECEASPVARNVLAGHIEATSRAMKLIAQEQGTPTDEAIVLNRLRRTNERWTDLLLGLCDRSGDSREFSHSEQRLTTFARAGRQVGIIPRSALIAAIRMAFRPGRSASSENASTNRRIVGGILACFGPEHFGATGTPYPYSIARLYEATADVHGVLDLHEPGESPDVPGKEVHPARRHTDRFQ